MIFFERFPDCNEDRYGNHISNNGIGEARTAFDNQNFLHSAGSVSEQHGLNVRFAQVQHGVSERAQNRRNDETFEVLCRFIPTVGNKPAHKGHQKFKHKGKRSTGGPYAG